MKNFFSFLLIAAMLFAAVSCTDPANNKDNNNDNNNDPVQDNNDTVSPYDSVITKYTELLTCIKDGKKLPVRDNSSESDSEKDILDTLYSTVDICEDVSKMGYATLDLDRNGTEELVLLSKDYKVYAIFTLISDTPSLLVNTNGRGAIDSEGTIYYYDYLGNDGNSFCVKNIVDGKLEGLTYGVKIGETANESEYYKIENSERTVISFAEKEALDYKYMQGLSSYDRPYTTKASGLRFIPAIGSPTESNAPVADFTSYGSILTMYKNIVNIFFDYSSADFLSGKYDNMYKFTDNESFRAFTQILCSARNFRPSESYYAGGYPENGNLAYGYAKKDLNGDGIEELVLLVDNFDIIAIFTMKDGKALLVDSYGNSCTGSRSCWIGSDGRLRVEEYCGNQLELSFTIYSITEDGALKTDSHFMFGTKSEYDYNSFYRAMENGKMVEISREKYIELYSEYDICPDTLNQSEYVKMSSGLKFTPLFEHIKPDETFSNKHFTSLPSSEFGITILSVSDSGFTFSFHYFKYNNENMELLYETVITADATLSDGSYVFDNGSVSGKVEIGVGNAWLTIESADNEHIDCQAYLFDYSE